MSKNKNYLDVKIKAVIFDFDGVIVDLADRIFLGYKYVFDNLKIKYSEDDFNQCYGLSPRDHIRKILEENRLEFSDQQIQELVDQRKIFLHKIHSNSETDLLPGVKKLIQEIHGSFLLAIATSATRQHIEAILPKLGLIEYFDAIVTSSEVKNGKPHPEVYLEAAKKLNVDPKYCVGIEDTDIGITAVKLAGMKAIAVTLTNKRKHDFSKADLIIESLEDLDLDIIKKI